ncbi:P-loop containing nucleoside triphosphate hydrolase protein [Fomitopsis serialis]|uniref:P-loop containing nucleoside triphosphate hydrolase protein n=1 Tax=Fomitopsis serialis TaxID=139415 RepID=UPI002007B17C|nr:P-loop containing nucleoside triphosphate hydrolase protein [Neoantrodia serialis]KAH9929200.1 P-loop containing nucleoside triphosphate hydrolase protein [Neoantrodia serialis]
MIPRHKAIKKHRWTLRKEKISLHKRPILNDNDVQKLTRLMEEKYQWEPRPFQVAGVQAQLEGVDMIIQAPTGAGKTAIVAGAHLWPHDEAKVTIMVSPLLSLEDEMVKTFKDQFNLNAVAVSSQNGSCSPTIVRDILALKYQIILASPEMLQSRTFINRVLRNSKFTKHILSMVIDEAHCVSHWGADFRKKYASLGVIRAFLPRGVPVIAVTATLTARVRRDIHSKLHFPKGGSRFFNAGNGRPNVALVVRAAEHPLNTYEDLDFVLPQSITSPDQIPKTWIYVDNINTGTEIIDYLTNQLEKRTADHPNGPLSADVIRPFNATLSADYRTAAMEAFRKGTVRVLVCTEAAGMGCDIPDIDIVVQWKLPATFSNFIQRAGRAARGRGREGLAILIVERSAYALNLTLDEPSSNGLNQAPRLSDAALPAQRSNKAPARRGKPVIRGRKKKTSTQAKANKEYADAHGINRGGTSRKDGVPASKQPCLDPDALDEGLLAFVQSTTCRRRVWADAFESPFSAPTGALACCDICHPGLLDRTRPGPGTQTARTKRVIRGLQDVEAQSALYQWRDDVYERDHAYALYDSTAILDDAMVDRLTTTGNLARDVLVSMLKPSWIWWDKYGTELITHIATLDITFTPKPKKPSKGKHPRVSPASAPGPPATKGAPALPSELAVDARQLQDAAAADAQCTAQQLAALDVQTGVHDTRPKQNKRRAEISGEGSSELGNDTRSPAPDHRGDDFDTSSRPGRPTKRARKCTVQDGDAQQNPASTSSVPYPNPRPVEALPSAGGPGITSYESFWGSFASRAEARPR